MIRNNTIFGLLMVLVFMGCGENTSTTSATDSGSVTAAPESVQSEIEDRLNGYLAKTNEKDWEGSFDYLHPIIFDIAPREQMIAAFEQMDATGFNILVEDSEITGFQNLVDWEGQRYTKFAYDCDMQVILGGEQFQDPMVAEMMQQQMIQQYGEDNVVFDSLNNTFDVNAQREVWAITGEDDRWYFVEENPQLYLVLDQIVPDTVQTMISQ